MLGNRQHWDLKLLFEEINVVGIKEVETGLLQFSALDRTD